MQTLPNKPELVTVKIENQNNNNQPKNNGLQEWINEHITETIGSLVIVSLILFGGSVGNTWTAYRGFRDSITKEFKIQELSGQIIHLDEVLTMSARMAASTGETRWEDRYNNFVEPLDKAIKETLTLVPEVTQQNTAQTDQANLKLVEMETKAFELVKAKKSQEALELLLGKEYEEQKQIYSQGIKTTIDNIKIKIAKDLEFYSSRLRNSVIFAGITLPVLIISWAMVFWLIKSYISARQQALNELSSSQKELLQLNEELEGTSQKIIEQEKITQEENEILQTDISQILEVVSTIEEGDLTINAEVNDRTTGLVADTLNRLVEELAQVLQQVLETAKQVSKGTDNLQIISKTVADGTIKQAQAVSQVKDLSQQVENSAQNAVEKVETTKKSLSSLELTVKAGEKTINSLNEDISILQQGTDRIIQQMKTLGEFVGLADQFVQDQGDIAQQTQVLALNAALVAARAGEQKDPRRFEMVAQEFEGIAKQVSFLAQKTNEGLTALEERTGQIHTVVATVDTEVQELGNLVGGFTKGVELSKRLFRGVRNVTQKAIAAEENVAQSNQAILTATVETVKAIKNIEKTTMETANITKYSLKQSETMEKLSNELLERIKFFKLPEE